MTATDEIRRWDRALPEVEETTHFRVHVPVFKVHGRTFCGLSQDETTAVFRISEVQANAAALADPSTYEAVRRQDARKSFLGLQANLANVSKDHLKALVAQAWHHQAPKRLIADHDQNTPPVP